MEFDMSAGTARWRVSVHLRQRVLLASKAGYTTRDAIKTQRT